MVQELVGIIKRGKRSDNIERLEAIRSLRSLGQEAVGELIAAFEHRAKDRDMDAAYVAKVLGELGGRRAINALVEALNDKHPETRNAAAEALHRLRWQPTTDTQSALILIALRRWREAGYMGAVALEPLSETLRMVDPYDSINNDSFSFINPQRSP
jgi:hypothetical protein